MWYYSIYVYLVYGILKTVATILQRETTLDNLKLSPLYFKYSKEDAQE